MGCHIDLENIHSFNKHLFSAHPVLDILLVALNLIVTLNSIFIIWLILQIIGLSSVIHTSSANHITIQIISKLVYLLSIL